MTDFGDRRNLLDGAAALIRSSGKGPTNSGARLNRPVMKSQAETLLALDRLARSVGKGQVRIGDMPPRPPTFRAKVGAFLVQIVRRALFWYSTQIFAYQKLVADAAAEQLELWKRTISENSQIKSSLASLSEKVDKLAGESARGSDQASGSNLQALREEVARLDTQLRAVTRELELLKPGRDN